MRFSWGRSCSRSLALPVLCRTHPAQRLFDAFVVLPVVVSVNRDEHLVAGMVLPMLGMDGLRRHAAVACQCGEQARPGALPDRQSRLLIVDELGCIPIDEEGCSLLLFVVE